MKAAAMTWPVERIGEALEALVEWAGIVRKTSPLPSPPPDVKAGDDQAVARWLPAAAAQLGVETLPILAQYQDFETMLAKGGPMLLRLYEHGGGFLLIRRYSRQRVQALAPDLTVHRVAVAEIRALVCAPIEGPASARIEQLLAAAEIAPRRVDRARRQLMMEQLRTARVGGCWLLQTPPGTSFWRQMLKAGLVLQGVAIAATHLVQYLLLVGSWWLIGRGALSGQLDAGWLLGWGLMVLTMVPFLVLTTWLKGRFAIDAGSLIKRRLMAGLLRFDPEQVRDEGAGQLLGRVLEADAMQRFAIGGGYLAVLATIEIVLALLVLSAGAGGLWHALLLVLWVGLTTALVYRFYFARDRWVGARLDLTHDLVERMVGHRTRLVQQLPELWHQGEDQLVYSYNETARHTDALRPHLVMVSGGWRLLGLVGLAAPFVSGQASMTGLAVGLGGVLLAGRAIDRFAKGIEVITGAVIGWKRIAPVFRSAARSEPLGDLTELPATQTDASEGEPIIDAREISFSYAERDRKAIDRVDLQIVDGDRLLLLGPSGGGKSTLASLLCGIRSPHSGLLLQRGIDFQTTGAQRWRQAIAAAPQFHENHVLTETFLFNLLMGREWPPGRQDIKDAVEICQELGLGELLEQMPSGLQQMVGDTGWQLSHGEQSRLFVARALLQGADLVILDESFGALDPENLQRAIACAKRRAKTLLVIAHP
jgi:ATP-binding cassette subfamily B protein